MRSIEIPQPKDRDWRYRAFEILPGALTFLILSLPVILGIFSPGLAAYLIFVYLLIWFVRAISVTTRVLQGHRQMEKHRRLPWKALNKDLENLSVTAKGAPKWHARNVERVRRNMLHSRIKPSEVIHAVFIAFYNESIDVLEPTVKSVIEASYDPKKIILILAYEQRGGPKTEAKAKHLLQKYAHYFYAAQAIRHPQDIPGEVIGKGGNVSYAGRQLQKFLQAQDIDPNRVIVTTLDADNHPDKQYFGALTYTFCSTEEPKHASYQPVTMYLNNIWDAPAPMRVVATGNSYWNVVLSMRPHLLRNFSAHSQSMAALIDTDFWSVRTIVEDGHQFWRTYFRYDSNHEVYPIHVPIYQDAVFTDSYKRTLKMQFIQVRRWAWGASDIAYVANQGFFKPNNIPKYKLIAKFLRLIEGHLNWSTAPLILLLAAYPPFLFHTSSFLGNELPQYASKLQRIAMVGILISLYLSMRWLPPKPARYKRRRTVWMILQWVYLIPTTLVYSSFAAINAQTRLAFGWYLGWVITEKSVRTDEGVGIKPAGRDARLRNAARRVYRVFSRRRRQPN